MSQNIITIQPSIGSGSNSVAIDDTLHIQISRNGSISRVINGTSGSSDIILDLKADLIPYLGNVYNDATIFRIAFLSKKKNPTDVSDLILIIQWVDLVTEDIIAEIRGNLTPINYKFDTDPNSFQRVAEASGLFKSFEITTITYNSPLFVLSTLTCFNEYNTRQIKYTEIDLLNAGLPEPDETQLLKILKTLEVPPAYLVLPDTKDLKVANALFNAVDALNIPLKMEFDPTYSEDQVIIWSQNFVCNDHRVEFLWSPNICRPRDAVTEYGLKVPCYAIGQYVGMLLKRNEKLSKLGIPLIADPVAGANYPFTYRGMELRSDIYVDEEFIEKFAKYKINVIRPIYYDIGAKMVLSDVLTQYDDVSVLSSRYGTYSTPNSITSSALKLVNASEIVTYTANRCIQILKRHLLKGKKRFLLEASRDIDAFLSACVSADLLQPSQDLGGKPYVFEITENPLFPFERVNFYLERTPNGATRSVVFNDVVSK